MTDQELKAELEKLALTIDRVVGMAAAAAGYAAALPGADKVKVSDAMSMANELAFTRVSQHRIGSTERTL